MSQYDPHMTNTFFWLPWGQLSWEWVFLNIVEHLPVSSSMKLCRSQIMDVWNKTSTPTTFCITFTKYPHKLSYDPHNMTAHKTHPEFVGKGTATPNRPVCYKTSVQRGGLRSITRNQVLSRWEERFIWYEHISPDSRCLHGSCCAVHKKN